MPPLHGHRGWRFTRASAPRRVVRQPAARTPALRRGTRLDRSPRIRGPRRQWRQGQAPGAGCARRGREAAPLDVLVCWRLDRLGCNLRHLVMMLEDLHSVGVAFVSLGEGIDFTTPAGKLQLHILAGLAEFERERIREHVRAGLSRVKASGRRLGRPERQVADAVLAPVRGLPVREAARRLGVSPATAHRWLAKASILPPTLAALQPQKEA
jgi:hypothetical protein